MPGKWHHCQVWWTGHGCLARCSPPRGAVQWSDAVTCWTCSCVHTYWDRLLYRYCMYVRTYVHVQGSGVLECGTCLLVCVVCVWHVLMFHCTICLPTSTCRYVHSVCSVYIESVCSCSWQWWEPACPSLFWQDNGCHGMHHPVALATQDWSSLQEGSQCEDDWLSASCGKGKGNDAKGFRHQGVYKCVCVRVRSCMRVCVRVWGCGACVFQCLMCLHTNCQECTNYSVCCDYYVHVTACAWHAYYGMWHTYMALVMCWSVCGAPTSCTHSLWGWHWRWTFHTMNTPTSLEWEERQCDKVRRMCSYIASECANWTSATVCRCRVG